MTGTRLGLQNHTERIQEVKWLPDTLSIIPSMFPSSTLFLMFCAVSETESDIFLVALLAKLKMYSV